MSIAADDRARVPFALVGVVLLVTATTFGVAVQIHRPGPTDDELAALEVRTDARAQLAVRRGAIAAGRAAGAAPVVEPAETDYGAVLAGESPFERYLRLRIYLRSAGALSAMHVEAGPVAAGAALPSIDDPTDARAAIEAVSLTRLGNGTRVRVTVEDVTIAVRRQGEVVQSRTVDVTVVLALPVLALHGRVADYEAALNRGPTGRDGLGRRMTARLYAMTWARGYAQWGKAPIQNVVGTRHVELATNGAMLSLQREYFGTRDPAGSGALARASARVGAGDLLGAAGYAPREWPGFVLGDGRAEATTSTGSTAVSAGGTGPGPGGTGQPPDERPLTVGVNRTADVAFMDLFGPAGRVGDVTASVYTAEATLVVDQRVVRNDSPAVDRPAGPNWTLQRTERGPAETTVDRLPGDGPDVGGEWYTLRTFERLVTERERVTWHWSNGSARRTTEGTHVTETRVAVAVVARPNTATYPDRPIESVFEPDGPLGGRNLADVTDRAWGRLVARRGGPDDVATDVVAGLDPGPPVTLTGQRPHGLRPWVYAEIAPLRERVRNVTVTVPRGRVGTGQVVPARRLARRLQADRTALIDPPARYRNVPHAARIAVRAVYVDAVIAALRERAGASRERTGRMEGALGSMGVNLTWVEQARTARHRESASGGPAVLQDPLVGAVSLQVEGGPPYLTAAAIDRDLEPSVARGESFTPLAARNVNVVTVPYGNVADGIVGSLFGDGQQVDLATAARALRAANATLERRDDPELGRKRAKLSEAVADSMSVVRGDLRGTIRRTTGLESDVRRAAVRDGLGRWETRHARALAVANGSAAPAIAAAAARRGDLSDRERDLLATALRVQSTESLRSASATAPESVVNGSVSRTRRIVRKATRNAVESGVENLTERARTKWLGDVETAVPAGLPVTPVPSSWYATTNLWHVSVRGEFARFAVSAPVGTPGAGGLGTTYVRAGQTVAIDIDGDGHVERLGRARRIRFAVQTAVVVVVPPGGDGVGDVDGQVVEQSGAWPYPGYEGEGRSAWRTVTAGNGSDARNWSDTRYRNGTRNGSGTRHGDGTRNGSGTRDGNDTRGKSDHRGEPRSGREQRPEPVHDGPP